MNNFDKTVLRNVVSNFYSADDFINFVSCCKQFNTIMRDDLYQLFRIFTSQSCTVDLLELLFSSSLHPGLDVRLPHFVVPVPQSLCESEYRSQFVNTWKHSVPIETLLRGAELVKWSRASLPGQFQTLVNQSPDDIRDITHLILHHEDSGNRIYNLAMLLANPDNLHMMLQNNFSKKLDTARRVRALSQINEAALAHRTIAEIDACLNGELPLKIEMHEYNEDRHAFQAVDPRVTARPQLNKTTSQFILHARFGNEPKEKELVFEWSPAKGVFRTQRSRSLRTAPYEHSKTYSMRLTPDSRRSIH